MTDISRAKIQDMLEKLGKDKIIHQANLNGVEGAIGILTLLLQDDAPIDGEVLPPEGVTEGG